MAVDDGHKFNDIVVIDGDLHTLSPQHIGRAHQYWISQLIRCLQRLFGGKHSMPLRSRNPTLFQNLIKQLPVLCGIHIFCAGSKNRNPHLHQCLGELDGGLSAKLNDSSIGFFNVYNIFYILRSQRLKVQFSCHIKICTYGLRIVIYDNGLITALF